MKLYVPILTAIAVWCLCLGLSVYNLRADQRQWVVWAAKNGCKIVGTERVPVGFPSTATAWLCADGKIYLR